MQRLALFQPKMTAETVILFNYVHFDGIGDFYHLLDIAVAFAPYAAKMGIKIVLFIVCLAEKRALVENKIRELDLNLELYLFDIQKTHPHSEELIHAFQTFIVENEQLRLDLKNALSLFQISTGTTKEQKDILLAYCRHYIPVVTMSEHTGLRCAAEFTMISHPDERDAANHHLVNINDRWMGLSEKRSRYGIKLKDPLSISREEALLALENKSFLNALLAEKEAPDFLSHYQFIPVYLQNKSSIYKFIAFCFQHTDIASKNIVFYINNYQKMFNEKPSAGLAADEYTSDYPHLSHSRFRHDEVLMPLFECEFMTHIQALKHKTSNISHIEINVNTKRRMMVFDSDSSAKDKIAIRILTDFDLSDHDYRLLFHFAHPLAAVSGDNTFEKALSHDLLPFLQSENKYEFERGIRKLGKLSKKYWHDIPELNQQDPIKFFSKNMRLDTPKQWADLLTVDLNKLYNHWPTVTQHLREDYNLYRHLEAIFYQAILHMSAELGDTKLLHDIVKHFPAIDFNLPNKCGETPAAIAEKNNHALYLRELDALTQTKSHPYTDLKS